MHVLESQHFLDFLDNKIVPKYKYFRILEIWVGFRQYVSICMFISDFHSLSLRVLT